MAKRKIDADIMARLEKITSIATAENKAAGSAWHRKTDAYRKAGVEFLAIVEIAKGAAKDEAAAAKVTERTVFALYADHLPWGETIMVNQCAAFAATKSQAEFKQIRSDYESVGCGKNSIRDGVVKLEAQYLATACKAVAKGAEAGQKFHWNRETGEYVSGGRGDAKPTKRKAEAAYEKLLEFAANGEFGTTWDVRYLEPGDVQQVIDACEALKDFYANRGEFEADLTFDADSWSA